ncbi:MAG: hypothetical protein AB1489_25450, partial [Acidobacteriota bacterium]
MRKLFIFFMLFIISFEVTCISNYPNYKAYQKNGDIIQNLFVYNKNDILNYLKSRNVTDLNENFFTLKKNSLGTVVYLFEEEKNRDDKYCVSILSFDGGFKKLEFKRKPLALNDNGEIVAWLNDESIQFNNGDSIPLQKFGGRYNNWGFEPSGKYFFIEKKQGVIEL